MHPSVTVVIPAFKAAATLRRAIESVEGQVGVAEVIVVLDGPDPEAQAIVDSAPSLVRAITHAENRGVQAARTTGLDAARGRYVMFLDSDDYHEGALLGPGSRAMAEASADIGFAAMEVEAEDGSRRTVTLAIDDRARLFGDWLGEGTFVAPCAVLWRTDFLRRIGGWDLGLCRQEDGEAVLRGLLLGARGCALPDGRAVYVQHRGAHRLTGQVSNMASLLDVPAKLLDIRDGAVERDVVERAAAKSYANAARSLSLRGLPDLAREARRRAEVLGGARPAADPPFRGLYRLFPFGIATVVERAIRAIARRPY